MLCNMRTDRRVEEHEANVDGAPNHLLDFIEARINDDVSAHPQYDAGDLGDDSSFAFGCTRCAGKRQCRVRAESAWKRTVLRTTDSPVILAALVAVYADHPDYRPEWAN